MKYYRDVDYFLYFEDFPHMGIPGVTALNSDGTVNIFINTLYNIVVQARTIRHELRHMVYGHFSADWLTITDKEVEADNEDDPNCLFADDFSYVEYTGTIRMPPIACAFVSREAVIKKIERIYLKAGILHVSATVPDSPYLSTAEADKLCADVQNVCDMAKSLLEKRRSVSAKNVSQYEI